MQEAAWGTLGALSMGGLQHLGIDATYVGGVFGSSVLGVGGLFWYHQMYLSRLREDMVSFEYLRGSFQRTHAREVQDADEFVASLWQRVRSALQTSLKTAFEGSPTGLNVITARELQQLDNLVEKDIPRLRRMASDGVP